VCRTLSNTLSWPITVGLSSGLVISTWTLKSIDYNVAMTFILNNNNNLLIAAWTHCEIHKYIPKSWASSNQWEIYHFMHIKIQVALLSQRGRAMLRVVSSCFNSTIPRAQFFLLLVTSTSNLPVRTIRLCSVVFGVTSSIAVIHTIHGRPCMCIARDRAWSVSRCTQSWTTVTVGPYIHLYSPFMVEAKW